MIKQRNLYIGMSIISISSLVGLCFLFHTIFIGDSQQEIATLQQTLVTEKEVLYSMQNQEEDPSPSLRTLITELPVTKSTDQVLTALERAESVSQSVINNIRSASPENYGEAENNNEEVIRSIGTLPEGVQTLNFEVELFSKSFDDFLLFLDQLSNHERLVGVNSIIFDDEQVEGYGENIHNYFIEFSVFYYPELSSLKDEQSTYNYQRKSNKNNPFETKD
ncbi:hypothetical protein [Halobacillus seohaensis]|uniref:Pilus assembly protein, PilO n=1 Tax=Halobacillus seohaensis TaxID=447421 RepID=A0ABW2EHC6_9BACI